MITSRSHCCKQHYFILFIAKEYSVVYIYHLFFTNSSVHEHSVCYHIVATISNAAMNNRVLISLQISVFVFSDMYLSVDLLGHIVIQFLDF